MVGRKSRRALDTVFRINVTAPAAAEIFALPSPLPPAISCCVSRLLAPILELLELLVLLELLI